MKALFLSAMVCLACSCSTADDKLAEKGGHSILLVVEGRVYEGGAKIPVSKDEVEQAILVIQGRLEEMGIAEMIVSQEGEGGILLKLPGVGAEEAGRISAMLEKSYQIALHEVSPRNDEIAADGKSLAQRVLDGDEIVPGYRAYTLKGKDGDGNDYATPILINRRKALGGEDIAVATLSPQDSEAVLVTLSASGTDKMIAFTKDMRPSLDRIAIVMDGDVMSAPVVQSVPLGKNFMINGLDEPGEAQSLAISLMHPLGNPLKVKEVRPVAPAGK